MKPMLLVAAVAGALGAAVAVLLTEKDPPPPRAPLAAPAVDPAALESAFRRALLSVFPAGRPETAEPEPRRAAEEEPDAPRLVRREADRTLPAVNQAVLEGLQSFPEDEDLRRTWMFRGESDVLEWIGTPASVWVYENGVEAWRYPKAGGTVEFWFHRGRLIGLRG